jgi:uncharacterized membrane protein YeaQ/YmgE (transglycosylase-associated protein family)
MSIIAWIVLGLAAGLLANVVIPGRRSQGLILTCLIGILGALGGGWAATTLFHVHTLRGFFNLSTWLTAIAGSAILLLGYHLVRRTGKQQHDPARSSGIGPGPGGLGSRRLRPGRRSPPALPVARACTGPRSARSLGMLTGTTRHRHHGRFRLAARLRL